MFLRTFALVVCNSIEMTRINFVAYLSMSTTLANNLDPEPKVCNYAV